MCTRALWLDSGQGVIVGRNMDWERSLGTNLWVLPREIERTGIDGDSNPLTWRADYGSLVATAYDLATADGINERGLAAHILWLAESDYGPRDASLPALSMSMWAQLFLDRFATVTECVPYMAEHPFQVRPQAEPVSGRWGTVHLALDDATGDSAIVEYIDGAPRVHHDRAYRVMTNSPPFDQQLDHLRRYEGFGGRERLPGTTEAADRFVRASYYLARLPPAESRRRAYAALLSVMCNAAQSFGVADPQRPYISTTIWRTLADLTGLVYAFESSFSPDIIWVRVDQLDMSRCSRVDLSAEGLVGEVNDRFVPAEPFTFLFA
ncbi:MULTISPECIES: linear amide C-N hydrolase [unclassified Microbulbifer]|uniref:linear amide C-N hydrolase n=1 Tax=unclassified Microbulbifer TaxID=2619833 RepID=UPI0027E55E7C|nr:MULTISPECIES: linear amide C-N hydrolase [unclassified Microbulbifer]